jgi:hypothetical protein
MPSTPTCDVRETPVIDTPPLLGQNLYALVVPPVWTELDVLSPIRSIKQWSSDQLPRYIALARNRSLIHMAKGLANFSLHRGFRHLTSLPAASQWFFPRRKLEDLPTEVLVDILQYVGWRDILVCRQVGQIYCTS